MGRKKREPTKLTVEVQEEILERIASGETLRGICRSDEKFPTPQAVCYLALNDDVFAERYARAREIGIHQMVDEIVEISDDGSNDWMERNADTGDEAVNHEHISRSRLRVDTRKWLASKVVPKLYGDKVDHNVEGSFTVNIGNADSDL